MSAVPPAGPAPDRPDWPNGATRLYGVMGHPVSQSLSPAMHNAAFRALGLNAAYVAFPVAPEHLSEAVLGLAAAGVEGFNLTVPHKTAILPLLHEVRPEARAIGAVNTVRHEGSRLVGTNTDGAGFLHALADDLAFEVRGRRVLVVGAGGAARGIAFALLEAGAGALVIANRTRGRAEALAADCRTRFPAASVEAAGLDEVAGAAPDLLVQTTSVGMGDGQSPLELAPVGVREAVADIIYHPPETPLLTQARALGLRGANGIGMLLHQGALAFRFWTGQEPPVPVMREALLAALHAREA